jgi:hypothetical protein
MLKWHAKHLDEMQEIGAFERSLKDRMEEAKVMYQDNLDLLSDLSVHPF